MKSKTPETISMSCIDPSARLDDESFALQLQIEEIEYQRERQTGKWTEGNPPDFSLAFDAFEAELKWACSLVDDMKLAHSIARAVESDAGAIEESIAQERQCANDRYVALTMEGNISSSSAVSVPLPEMPQTTAESIDWDHVLRASTASTFSTVSSTTVAGPSAPYAARQAVILEQLPQLRIECSACGDAVHPHLAVKMACKDVYCKVCVKRLFLDATKDQSLFPPKCHRNQFDISDIRNELTAEELAAFEAAQEEFTSTNKVYCANTDCARFIRALNRTKDLAHCANCGIETCVHCKKQAHFGGCSADPERQSLILFAAEQGWKKCIGCGEMVFKFEGCNHMT
jgi:hypothetical protein